MRIVAEELEMTESANNNRKQKNKKSVNSISLRSRLCLEQSLWKLHLSQVCSTDSVSALKSLSLTLRRLGSVSQVCCTDSDSVLKVF